MSRISPTLLFTSLGSNGAVRLGDLFVDSTDRHPPDGTLGSDCETGDGVVHIMGAPFGYHGRTSAFVDAGTFVSIFPARYELKITTESAQRILVGPTTLISVTDAMWAEASKPYRAVTNRTMKCDPRLVRPKAAPSLRAITSDEAGRVWVEAMTPAGPTFDSIDIRTGAARKYMVVGSWDGSIPWVARSGRIYAVVRDDDDVQSIVVYKIPR
jgi:hypothetical protein